MSDDRPLDDDDRLLELLGDAIVEHDVVPDSMRRFAEESHRLLSFESELAEIVADSALEAPALRSTGQVRILDLEVRDVTVSLEIDDGQVLGSTSPQTPNEVAVETPDGERSPIEVNGRGFFAFTAPPSAFRLRLVFADFEARSDWLR